MRVQNDQPEANRLQPISSTEERQATGRYVALGTTISLIFIGLYHAWEHRLAVLAGLIVPALIMFLYLLWVLYSATKDAKRLRRLQAIRRANLVAVITVPIHNATTPTHGTPSTTSGSEPSSLHHKLSTSRKSLNSLDKNILNNKTATNLTPNRSKVANVFYPNIATIPPFVKCDVRLKPKENCLTNKTPESKPCASIQEVDSVPVCNDRIDSTASPAVSKCKLVAKLKKPLPTPVQVHSKNISTVPTSKSFERTYSIA